MLVVPGPWCDGFRRPGPYGLLRCPSLLVVYWSYQGTGPGGHRSERKCGNGDGVRVTVDLEKCLGYANCVADAPEVFEIPEESMVVRVLQDDPPAEMRSVVEAAALDCPARAITLTDV